MAKEKRRRRRQPLRYSAWAALGEGKVRNCLMSDISETGARLDFGSSSEVADCFVLLLSRNGAARRFCNVVWRRGTEIGVKFARSPAEAEQATLVPKPGADAQAPDAAPAAAPHGKSEPVKSEPAEPEPGNSEPAKPEPAKTA